MRVVVEGIHRWVGLGLLVFLSLPVTGSAQGLYSVSMRSEPFQPIPIAHPEAQSPATHNDLSGVFHFWRQMDFEVLFYGQLRSKIWISSNGLVRFVSDTARYSANAPIAKSGAPQTAAPNGFIAVWWDDTDVLFGGTIKTQIIGTTPGHRTAVIQWNMHSISTNASHYTAQLWLREGASTIEIHYGAIAGAWTATMGVENDTGTDGTYVPSFDPNRDDCGSSCGASDWHPNTVVTFSQGPDLRIVEVRGEEEGFAGVPMEVSATVANVGGEIAEDFTVRFWISPTTSLGPEAKEVLTVNEDVRTLESQSATRYEARPRLPIDLEEGTYYLLAEADPHLSVPETNRRDNVGAFGPIGIGLRAPNLLASRVDVSPDKVQPGGQIAVAWRAANVGNLDAHLIDYELLLSTTRWIGPSSVVFGKGRIETVAMQDSVEVRHVATIPEDLEPGIYHVGVALDPHRAVFEHDRSDNVATSEGIVVAGEDLLVLTKELPPAQAGVHYSIRLVAEGGDGYVHWSVAEGSTIPLGLSLVEEMGERGVATFLRGVPAISQEEAFEFTLSAMSARRSEEQTFRLRVEPGSGKLTIPNESLAFASFGFDYEEWLSVIGGHPPFDWSVAKGDLPFGVLLRSDGLLTGMPLQDGAFEVTVQVVDSTGMRATRVLLLDVAPPSSLTCVTRVIPDMALGEEKVRVDLIAAGGTKRAGLVPYLWSQGKTMRLVTGVGQEEAQIDGLPAGLELRDARISGSPKEIGDYVWTTELSDAAGGKVSCPIRLRVAPDRGLTITTQALPTAFAGRSYLAQLDAAGGTAPYVWSELGDGRVLEELGLSFNSETGELRGTPRMEKLEGEDSKVFTFMLRVRDAANRVGIAPMTIRVDAKPPQANGPAKAEESRCQAAAGAPALWALAAIAAAALLRRRR